MSLMDILIHLMGSALFVFALMLIYYSIQRARLMKGSRGHQVMTVGTILLIVVSVIGTVDVLFFFGSSVYLRMSFVWIGALFTLVYGGFLVGKAIKKIYPSSLLRIAWESPGSIYNLIGISVLFFCGIPVYLLDILHPVTREFSWYSRFNVAIWAFGFANLALAARTHCLSGVKHGEEQEETILLRDDILAAKAYGVLINRFLAAEKLFEGLIGETLIEYFEYNPILFESCKLKRDGTIDFEPLLRNINRIHRENRVQEICTMFSALSSRLLELYSTVTSPKHAKEVLAKSYRATREMYRYSAVFFDILRSLPKDVLEEERIALLPREELETRVQRRTRDLYETKVELEKAKDYTDNIIKSMADTLIVVNPDATIKTVNRAGLDLLGYEENELIGKPIKAIFGEEVSLFKDSGLDNGLIKKGFVRNVEKTCLSKDGKEIPVFLSGSVMRDDNGRIRGIICVARDITEYKKAEEKIHVYQMRLRLLASKLTTAEERERRHLATELHDSIGQLLALCRIKLGELGRVTPSFDSRPLLEEIGDLLDQIIKYTRSLTLQLGPPVLYELGLEAALEWLVEYMQERYRIQTKFEVDGEVKSVDEELRVFLFRAVQELMVNIAKHAKTDKAKVSVCWENESIYLSVEDRGVGFNTASLDTPSGKDTGFGLFSIREHIKYFGGKLCIQSKPGEGTQVALTVLLRVPQKGTERRVR